MPAIVEILMVFPTKIVFEHPVTNRWDIERENFDEVSNWFIRNSTESLADGLCVISAR